MTARTALLPARAATACGGPPATRGERRLRLTAVPPHSEVVVGGGSADGGQTWERVELTATRRIG